MKAHPRSPLLIVASPDYLEAVADDLRETVTLLGEKDRLLIVSAGSGVSSEFAKYVVPSDGRLRRILGGALHSLNARLGRRLLQDARRWPLRTSLLAEKYERLIGKLPELKHYHRDRMTDEGIRRFIRGAIRKDPETTHTRLLRSLRDAGHACEQSRFGRLFRNTKDARNGS